MIELQCDNPELLKLADEYAMQRTGKKFYEIMQGDNPPTEFLRIAEVLGVRPATKVIVDRIPLSDGGFTYVRRTVPFDWPE